MKTSNYKFRVGVKKKIHGISITLQQSLSDQSYIFDLDKGDGDVKRIEVPIGKPMEVPDFDLTFKKIRQSSPIVFVKVVFHKVPDDTLAARRKRALEEVQGLQQEKSSLEVENDKLQEQVNELTQKVNDLEKGQKQIRLEKEDLVEQLRKLEKKNKGKKPDKNKKKKGKKQTKKMFAKRKKIERNKK